MKLLHVIIFASLFTLSTSIFASPVNINKASAAEIASALKGIGIKKANEIVSYRKANGKFKSAKDIVNVKGIGMATFKSNKKDILLK